MSCFSLCQLRSARPVQLSCCSVLRIVVRRADRQARNAVLGRAEQRRLGRVRPMETVVATLELEQPVAARHDPGPGAEDIRGVLGLIRRLGRRNRAVGHEEGIRPRPVRSSDRQAIDSCQLIVDPRQEALLPVLVRHRHALPRQQRRVLERRARLALVLVGREVVDLVLDDRSAEREADLLVRVRQYLGVAVGVDGHRIGGVEAVASEEAVGAAARLVGARLRDRLDFSMPADRPCVMSNMLVTIWNSAIASRLKRGWPKPEPATFCVICWPSRFSCQRSSMAPCRCCCRRRWR